MSKEIKLSKAQKEVVMKMRDGIKVFKRNFHPYTYTIATRHGSALNAASMTQLLRNGIIVTKTVDLHFKLVTLTPLGHSVKID